MEFWISGSLIDHRVGHRAGRDLPIAAEKLCMCGAYVPAPRRLRQHVPMLRVHLFVDINLHDLWRTGFQTPKPKKRTHMLNPDSINPEPNYPSTPRPYALAAPQGM